MMSRSDRTAAILAVLLVLAMGLLGGCGLGAGGSGSATTAAPKAAPDFSGTTLAGTEVSLSEYRGKPLVLAFMASW
jgi:cytochrome oxidase Cu insertion factor (SCO1/SenC/PrrC family)